MTSKTVLAEVEGWTPLIDTLVNLYGVTIAAVFGRIWRYCQMETGLCTASQETIAVELDISRATVNTAVGVLVRDGYLKDITPEIKNRPHVYADTGKAGLKMTISANVVQTGVKKFDTKPAQEGVGVENFDSTVENFDSRCQEILHPGVKNFDMKKVSLRDSLRDELREGGAPAPLPEDENHNHVQTAWLAVSEQLKLANKQVYNQYVKELQLAGYADGVISLVAPDQYTRDWVESRMGKQIAGLLSATLMKTVQINLQVRP